MSVRVDLNCDLGEGGAYDEALLGGVTSANVACGFHAGDPTVMRRTAELALRKGVAVGAHPGFRDPGGYGRREVSVTPEEAYDLTLYQIGALAAFAPLRHVKPHGALYAMAARDAGLADAMARAAGAAKLVLFALAGSEMVKAARRLGVEVAEEAFADRGYRADGRLVPRGEPGAMVESPDEAARRAVRLVREGKVRAVDGSDVAVRADTICVHGDTPGAPEVVRALREALAREGVEVRRFGA